MGRLGAISGAHPTVLDAGKIQKTDMLKMYVFLREWDDFFVIRGPLNGLLGRLGDFLGRLQTIEVPLGTLLCCLGSLLRLSDDPSDRLESARKARQGALGGPEGPGDLF